MHNNFKCAPTLGLVSQIAVALGAGDPYMYFTSSFMAIENATSRQCVNLGPTCFRVCRFLDPNARRKNATRESTATLKAWLNEHKKNPYPTKGEKIMLAIITKMTLTQVSTWFANARRRLKKDHKMTWEPRSRIDDDNEAGSDVEADDKDDEATPEEENISVGEL